MLYTVAHNLSSKYQSVLFFEAAQYSLVIREAKPIEGALDQELTYSIPSNCQNSSQPYI
jgi:hypothetical protein